METISFGCDDEDEDEEDDWEDEDHDGFDGYEDDEWGEEEESLGHNNKSKSARLANRRLSRRRRPPRRRRKPSTITAATVRMRHPASGTSLSWRTGGVKDTSGAELHEGASYRLVATVKEVVAPGAAGGGAAGGVEVTRCRLSLVTPDAAGGR